MKKIITSLSIALVSAIQAYGQVTEMRNVDTFHGLKIQSAIEVKYKPSSTIEVKVTAGEKYINDIKVVTVNGILEMYYDGNRNFNGDNDIKIDISGPSNIDFLEMTGAASFKNEDTLRTDKFKYDLSGASSAKVNLVSSTLSGEISGAASLKLFGKAVEAKHQSSGASSLKAYEFFTEKTTVSASGASSSRVRASKEIKGDASGASNLYFKGNPSVQDLETSGAGSVKRVLDDGSNAGSGDNKTINVPETPDTPGDTTVKSKSGKNNDTEINIGNKTIRIKQNKNKKEDDDEKKREKKEKNNKFADDNWAGFEFGIPGYLNNGQFQPKGTIGGRDMANLELNYGKSRHWAWNITDVNFKIIKHYLEFTSGIGLAWDNYAFRKTMTLRDDSGFVTYTLDTAKAEGRNYSYNKLRVNSLQVPLLLSFNTSGNESKTFRITAGAIVGWNYRSRVIQEYTVRDNFNYERRSKSNFGEVNPFSVRLQGSIGYGSANLFCQYNLTELFEKDAKNPGLTPITFGFRLTY
jgi:hypothetical protein